MNITISAGTLAADYMRAQRIYETCQPGRATEAAWTRMENIVTEAHRVHLFDAFVNALANLA